MQGFQHGLHRRYRSSALCNKVHKMFFIENEVLIWSGLDGVFSQVCEHVAEVTIYIYNQ